MLLATVFPSHIQTMANVGSEHRETLKHTMWADTQAFM